MDKGLRVLGLVSSTVLFILPAMLLLPTAHAQQDSSNKKTDELQRKIEEDILKKLEPKIKEEILQQLPQDIMKVLLQQNLLNRQIERGIDDYFKKQQQARAAALEKQEHVASEKAKNVRRVTASRDHIFGNPEAPVSLIEYSDFECPFCKRFHSVIGEVVEAHGGKVNLVYRHFPLGMHNPGAQKEAQASECAAYVGGNGVFWKYADAIYARTQSNGNGFPVSQLVPLAKEMGLNKKRFQACMDSDRFAPRVQEDVDEGTRIGIEATPTTILIQNETGEVMVQSGAVPSEAFKAAIDKMLGSSSPAKNSTLR